MLSESLETFLAVHSTCEGLWWPVVQAGEVGEGGGDLEEEVGCDGAGEGQLGPLQRHGHL